MKINVTNHNIVSLIKEEVFAFWYHLKIKVINHKYSVSYRGESMYILIPSEE
jgi:hypothetical protein